MSELAGAAVESALPHVVRAEARGAVVLSQLFPPFVGGSAVLLHNIYSRLPGIDVAVLTDGATLPGTCEHHGDLRIFRQPIAARHWGISRLGALHHHLQVARHLRNVAVDRRSLVHCARALPEGLAAMFARLAGGPRYACWAHGEDLVTAQTSRELALLTKLVFRLSAAAFANSQNTAAILRALGVPAEKIHVVYPAVDAQRFNPNVDGSHARRRFAGPDDVMLLSVGRLQRRKGHDAAIEAMARLRDHTPNLRYVIAGDGEERQRLEQLVHQHALGDRVFFAGVVPERELSAFYAACDVFLLPNRIDDGDIEGFGIVFLEAAATGKPTIGGNSGGVPEAVEHEATGLLVDGSPDAIAAAIRELAGSPSLRQAMGAAGRARVCSTFTWERAAEAVAQVHMRVTVES
jgi:phosphatidyl-myo-inositol dimannoside synthase